MTNKTSKSEDSYTERADGYGSAGAESESEKLPYEKEREKSKFNSESSTTDENGMPNQQGEVDQYNFRDH
jgi:hypothetical protein